MWNFQIVKTCCLSLFGDDWTLLALTCLSWDVFLTLCPHNSLEIRQGLCEVESRHSFVAMTYCRHYAPSVDTCILYTWTGHYCMWKTVFLFIVFLFIYIIYSVWRIKSTFSGLFSNLWLHLEEMTSIYSKYSSRFI